MEAQSGQLDIAPKVARPELKVLVDARKICDGGIGVYTENLIRGLLAQNNSYNKAKGVQLSLIGKSDTLKDFAWYDEVSVIEDDASPYSVDEMFAMTRRINTQDYDVFHVPHFTLPYGVKIPSVITIHDLIHIKYPEKKYYPIVASILIRSALHRASRVLTVSNATYEDIRDLVGNDRAIMSKISVIPNAIDPFFLEHPISADYLNTRFKLQGKYLLGVISMLKPHKGLKDILEAFKLVQEDRHCFGDLKLILVGKGTEGVVEAEELLEAAGSTKGVHLFGNVTKEDLLHLYSGALAMVVSSKAEGFCLPVLEAQALGTPVIARPVPAVLELLGNKDRAAKDFSVASLQKTIVDFLREKCVEQKQGIKQSLDARQQVSKTWTKKYCRDDIGRTILGIYDAVTDESSDNT